MRLSVGTRRSRDAQPPHSAATRLPERWPASRCALPAALTTCEPRPALTAVCWYPKILGRAFGAYALLATWSVVRAGRSFLSAVDGRNLVSPDASGASRTESAPNRGNLLSVDQVPTLKWQAAVFGFGRTVTLLGKNGTRVPNASVYDPCTSSRDRATMA